MKITDYQIVCDANLEALEDAVEEEVGEGWQPLGSPTVEYCTKRHWWGSTQEVNRYIQAMVMCDGDQVENPPNRALGQTGFSE